MIHLDSALAPGLYTLRTLYVAVIRTDLMGCYLSYENGQPFVMTQFEPNFARTFIPTFDEPSIKMIFEMTFITPSNLTILFNTPPRSSSPILLESRSGALLSYTQTTFEPTPPMSAYLLAAGIGPFQSIHQNTRYGVKLSIHFPFCTLFILHTFSSIGANPRDFEYALGVSVHALEYFQSNIGEPYPLSHLQVLLAPNFAAAAMENFGLILIRSEYLAIPAGESNDDLKRRIGYVLSHEIAHQWFGNLVTARDWSEVYLQEGFATLLGHRCVDSRDASLQSTATFFAADVAELYEYDVEANAVAIKPELLSGKDAVNSFSAVSYTKVSEKGELNRRARCCSAPSRTKWWKSEVPTRFGGSSTSSYGRFDTKTWGVRSSSDWPPRFVGSFEEKGRWKWRNWWLRGYENREFRK